MPAPQGPGVVVHARRQGHAISFADAAIASIAACHDFTVVTPDEAPFRAAGLPALNP